MRAKGVLSFLTCSCYKLNALSKSRVTTRQLISELFHILSIGSWLNWIGNFGLHKIYPIRQFFDSQEQEEIPNIIDLDLSFMRPL